LESQEFNINLIFGKEIQYLLENGVLQLLIMHLLLVKKASSLLEINTETLSHLQKEVGPIGLGRLLMMKLKTLIKGMHGL